MGCQTKGTGYHYGLDFVLSHSAENIQEVIDKLAKRNRGTKAVVTEREKPALRRQLAVRMKERRRKEARRGTRRFK